MLTTPDQLDRRIAQLRRAYKVEMSAKDIAREENCSPRTASERMRNFEYGALTVRNKRVIRCFTEGYIQYLQEKTVLQKGAA